MIKLALIGAGVHGYSHAQAIAALRRAGRHVEIEIVVDPVIARAAALADEFGVPNHGPPDLLAHASVDAVDICTNLDAHLTIALACVELGKPTLIESPLASTLEQAAAIIAAFTLADVPLFPGHSERFDPALRRLRASVVDGSLGDVGVVAVHRAQGHSRADGLSAWPYDSQPTSGRVLRLGIHDIDLACWLVNAAPVRVSSVGRRLAADRPESWASYSVQTVFSDGALALVTASWDVNSAEFQRLTCLAIGSIGRASHDSAHDDLVALPHPSGHAALGRAVAVRDQLAHWLDCITFGVEPVLTPDDARRSLAVALAADRSLAQSGIPVRLDEFHHGS